MRRGSLFVQRKCRLPTMWRRHAVQCGAERDVPNLPSRVGDIGRGKRRHVSYDVYFVCGRKRVQGRVQYDDAVRCGDVFEGWSADVF